MRQKHHALGLIALFIVNLIMGSTFTVSNISNCSENSPAATAPGTSSGIQGFGSQYSLLASQQADAVNIANYLVANATKVGAGVKWTQYYTNPGSLGIVDNLTGYYDGVAGVASFLGKMYEVTKNASYLTTASQAVYWLNQSSGIKVAPGKYKESEGQPRNYTGLEQGAAGVGQMYLDLYQASANQSYLLLAQEVANYLLSISQTVGSGMTWYYKEPVVVTNANNLPDAVNSITAGSITGTLADLAVGGSTYNIGSALIGGTTQAVNYEFYLNLSQWGLYNLIQHIEENKYSYLNLSIRLSSNVGLTSSAVQIGGSDPITYYAMPGGTISTTMQTITQVNTTGIINYIWQRNVGSIIRVKVNATNNAPFTISVDCLNATISYNDTIYNPDYGSGASGIGQFFLNLYAATGNLTYYYTAANVSRYLQYTQIPDTVGIYWGKEKYDNGLDQTLGYTSVADGVAGIGKFLVDLYKANISDSVPLALATQAANWVTSQSQSSTAPGYISYAGFPNYQDFLGSAMWVHYSNESSTDIRSGYYDGVAGVGDFLLDIASITGGAVGSYYFNNATQIATFLGSLSTGFLGPELLQMSAAFTYNWVDGTTTTQSSNSTRAGGVGDLLFLARCAHLTGSTAIGTTVDGGLRYLLALATNSLVAGSPMPYYYYDGLAGIGDAFLQASNFDGTAMQAGLAGLNYLLTQETPANSGAWPTSSSSSTVFSGAYQGVAGVGLAMLQGYESTGNTIYLNASIRAATRLSNPAYLTYYAGTSEVRYGRADGIAGIADFLLDLATATGNSTILGWANQVLWTLLGVMQGSNACASWSFSSTTPTVYNDLNGGTAGIAATLLHAFAATANMTYLTIAKGALNYLDSQNASAGYARSWPQTTGGSTFYTAWDYGAAGIGDVYLQAYQMTGNASYYNTASGAALWLSQSPQELYAGWQTSVGSSIVTDPIIDGGAGILKFSIQLFAVNASLIVNGLISRALTLFADTTYGIFSSNGKLSTPFLGWDTGLAGEVEVIASAYLFQPTPQVSNLLQVVTTDLLNSAYRDSSGAWHSQTGTGSLNDAGISDGSAGMALTMGHLLGLTNPSLSVAAPSLVNYDQTGNVQITTSDAFSSISIVFVLVYFNTPLVGQKVIATTANGLLFNAHIPGMPYQTNVSFAVFVVDQSGKVAFDYNGGLLYTYTVGDNGAGLQVGNVHFFVGGQDSVPLYGQDAVLTVDVTDPANSSGISSVTLTYTYAGNTNTINMFTVGVNPNQFGGLTGTVTFVTLSPLSGSNWKYGQPLSYFFNITDTAGNRVVTPANSSSIQDRTPPTIYPNYFTSLTSQEFPALSPVAVQLNVSWSDPKTALDSPMPPVGGAFVWYTIDGVTWQRVNLTIQANLGSGSNIHSVLYNGEIPGMNLGAVVRFVFGAQDGAGNVIYMDSNKILYTNFTLIPTSAYFYYTVTMNWLVFFIVVAIVAIAVVMVYVIYMRRGGYWERMRRSASAKATAISIEAKFTALYYFLAEKFDNLGRALRKNGRKVGDKLENFWDWAGNKLGDRWRGFWGGVAGTISNFFKGMGNAIGGFFTGLGDFITGVRWYQVLILVVFGLLLVVFPLISVFTTGSTEILANYPLVDTFFVGMGLILFIIGFVVAIMNLIYQISYK